MNKPLFLCRREMYETLKDCCVPLTTEIKSAIKGMKSESEMETYCDTLIKKCFNEKEM